MEKINNNKSEVININNQKMSLVENHQTVLKIFDAFNNLLKNDFDYFYTGGLMLFIRNEDNLERYHNDLDIYLNEDQLLDLKQAVDNSDSFKFISNMYKKTVNGHEYKITYKDFPVSIGIFLFERKNAGSIITKKYYYDDLPNMENLYVDERHFNEKYSQLVFNDDILYYNHLPYKMVSPEFIFYSKMTLKPQREKDLYDIKYAKNKVNKNLVSAIDREKQKKIDIIHKKLDESIIIDIETNNDKPPRSIK